MLTAAITWPPFTYTTFFFLLFNSIFKKKLCHLMLKGTIFSWLWVSFACWFFVFLSYCYFFFLFYFCTTVTTRTTTAIISSNANVGEGTPEINKPWSSKFRSFEGRKERATPKLILLPVLGLGSTHIHTQDLIVVLHHVMQPHMHLLSLYMGFKVNIWVVHSCVFLSLQPCNE